LTQNELNKVEIQLSGQRLSVKAAAKPELLRSPHRVFFMNALSFEGDDARKTYRLEGESAASAVTEVVRYLQDAGFSFALNDEAQNIYQSSRNDEVALDSAVETGKRLKTHPQNRISIPNLKRAYKPYQAPAVAHLVNVAHAANFSVPGSGKTAIVLMAFAVLRASRTIDKLVVIGPSAAFVPWEEEAKATLARAIRTVRIVGPRNQRVRLYRKAETATLILLTYQMASNDAKELTAILRRHKVMLVIDESHNIKRLEGGKWAEALIALAPFAAKRVILSGTPMPNSVLDLWSQFEFLWPENSPLGERGEFKYRAGSDIEPTIEQTRRVLFPLYWRIKKEDLGLPKPRFYTIRVKMSKYQQAIYNVIGAKVLNDIVTAPEERSRLRLWRRARMIRLLQAASNPTLLVRYSTEFRLPPMDASSLPVDAVIQKYSEFESPAKIKTLETLVRELVSKKRPVIIWTAFIHNILTFEKLLGDLKPAKLYGDIPRDDRENEELNRELIIRDFKGGRYNVLIANPSACAESISLHKVCRDAIYFDRTFNAAHYLQSLDRIHRVGLEKHDKVRYYILQSEDSIDGVIDTRLNEKMERMRRVLNEDLAPLDLESPADAFSEETEEEADFAAVVKSLQQHADLG
jgi:SNF2 family DNA or RNA helicase